MSLNQSEILSKMKEHQAAYSELAGQLKAIKKEEEQKQFQERQLARLEEYKTKYKYFVQNDGSVKEIDFAEVEKLIRSTFGQGHGYALGFDQTGMEGLGYDPGGHSGHSGGGGFHPMVEDEVEAQRYIAREKRRQEWIANSKAK